MGDAMTCIMCRSRAGGPVTRLGRRFCSVECWNRSKSEAALDLRTGPGSQGNRGMAYLGEWR